uniref:Capsid protein n=1 Tax=Eggplant carlavirus TaxID=2726259 RepID=A0A6G5VXU9_9VIRU|nr:coat protein [Eggplant carlavirus]
MSADTKQKGEASSSAPHDAAGNLLPDIDIELQKRLDSLRDYLGKNERAAQVTNTCFELGRPSLKRPASVHTDHSHIYSRWSLDQLSLIVPQSISNNMASAEEMGRVQVTLEGLGVPSEHVAEVLLQVAVYCKDTSSSAYMDARGTFNWKGGAIMADQVIATMRDKAETLRRVCRLYAPITWNYMLTHNAPPSDWAAMGFSHDNRFAAFDCFDYVENAAAVQPFEELIRRPTPSGKVAHNTYQAMALDKSIRNETYANYGTEVTGGRLGPEIERNHNNASHRVK